MRRLLCLMVIIAILSTGCAGMTESQKTQAQGTAVGTVAGAALGALAGQALGGDTKSTLAGAAIGAALGGGAGFAYGNHIAGKKNQFAKEEDYLNACIKSASEVNSETIQYNTKLANDVTQIKAEVKKLKSLSAKQKNKKEKLSEETKKVDAMLADAEKQKDKLNNEIGAQKSAIANVQNKSLDKVSELDREIKELEKRAADLDSHTQALASIRQNM